MWLNGNLTNHYYYASISSMQKELNSLNFKIETQAENFEKQILELKEEILELKNIIKGE